MNRKYSCLILTGLLIGSLCSPLAVQADDIPTGGRSSLFGVIMDLGCAWGSVLKQQWSNDWEKAKIGNAAPLYTTLELVGVGVGGAVVYGVVQYLWNKYVKGKRQNRIERRRSV